MCSIFGILDIKTDSAALRKSALEMSKRLRHRGPDWSGVYSSDKAILVHERLAIVDPGNGAQPLYNPERTHVLAVNGEIYNHKELEKNLKVDFKFQTHSDCEVLLALYKEKGPAFLDDLNGIFAFILYDAEQDAYLIGRDHMGIIPLYTGRDEHGNITVESPHPPLIAPGQVAQSLALMDPVGTNLPRNYDARPPASVLATDGCKCDGRLEGSRVTFSTPPVWPICMLV